MSLPCRSADLLATALLAAAAISGPGDTAAAAAELRVCADPNNPPFSDKAGGGFENRIAELLGRDLGMPVAYAWWPQRRGFIRNTLKAGSCDVLIGVPKGLELVATTRPYYRSSYVFVSRADGPAVASLDDAALRSMKIGVQLIGDDFANSPPSHALSRRGIIDNVRGYPVYGDYGGPDPAERIVAAVASGEVDVAVVWGPVAGYYARTAAVPLSITPVTPMADRAYLPMYFDMALGVRHEDVELRQRLNQALSRNREAIDAVLAAYGVPRLPLEVPAP